MLKRRRSSHSIRTKPTAPEHSVLSPLRGHRQINGFLGALVQPRYVRQRQAREGQVPCSPRRERVGEHLSRQLPTCYAGSGAPRDPGHYPAVPHSNTVPWPLSQRPSLLHFLFFPFKSLVLNPGSYLLQRAFSFLFRCALIKMAHRGPFQPLTFCDSVIL